MRKRWDKRIGDGKDVIENRHANGRDETSGKQEGQDDVWGQVVQGMNEGIERCIEDVWGKVVQRMNEGIETCI